MQGAHTGSNVASIVGGTLKQFGVGQLDSNTAKLGYFVLDNATNNDSAVQTLARDFKFSATQRRLRCACHIINLAAQQVLFGKDRDAFADVASLSDEEKFMADWRKAGPIGVLLDVLASICTPQARQLLDNAQRNDYNEEFRRWENKAPGERGPRPAVFKALQVVKPVKTRWNSYYSAFERATQLRNPIDEYIAQKSGDYYRDSARRREPANDANKPRLFIAEKGLAAADWSTISEYLQVLAPFKEATRLLEGRGKAGSAGAIWEVLPTLSWLIDELSSHVKRYAEAKYDDSDAPEDHVQINCQAALNKVEDYYARLATATPVYYIAARLHPAYKDYLDSAWQIPDDYESLEPHPRLGWLRRNSALFETMYKQYKQKKSATNDSSEPPRKVAKFSYDASSRRTEFLRSTLAQGKMQKDDIDELKRWDNEPNVPDNHPFALDPIQHWLTKETDYPTLSKMALDILSIPAAAADCERTFSELGDLLETRRLSMKPDLLSALQSLRSWKRLGLKPSKTSTSSKTALANESATLYADDSFTFDEDW